LIEDYPMTQDRPQTPLSDLRPGDEAVVAGIAANGAIRQRLMEMGFTRGAGVRVEKYAPMGDPMELSVKGYHLSLRRAECRCIMVDAVADCQKDGRGVIAAPLPQDAQSTRDARDAQDDEARR
jgi:Fe2+ transport system protein FeoA